MIAKEEISSNVSISGAAVQNATVATASKNYAKTTSISDLFSLKGKTTIITGAAGGLGLELAIAVIEAGGDVVCLDISSTPSEAWYEVQKLATAAKVAISYHSCDVTDEAKVDKLILKIAEQVTSPITGLVACAGIQQMIPALDYPIAGFRKILEVNTTGTFITAQAVARLMTKEGTQGSIVLIASMSGSIANKGLTCTAYNTSKAALHQMCRSLAAEWGVNDTGASIRVNTLSPGYILTDMTARLLEEKPQLGKLWHDGSMLGRLGVPRDFKTPVIFMLSDGSSFMTGTDLRVDGGHCAW